MSSRPHYWAFAAVCALAIPLPGQSVQWTQHQGNEAHNGYVPVTLDPAELHVRWTKRLTVDRAISPPAAASGAIAVVAEPLGDPQLWCYDHITGEERWTETFDAFDPQRIAPPVIRGSQVLTLATRSSNSGQFSGTDALLGVRYFDQPTLTPNRDYLAPAALSNVTFLPQNSLGGVAARQVADGAEIWEYEVGASESDWAAAADEDHVYLYQRGRLFGLDRVDGQVEFLVPDPSWTGGSHDFPTPMLGGLDNVIVSENNRIQSYDRNTGLFLWEVSGNLNEASAVNAGVIYARDYDGHVVALSELDGSFLWDWTPPNGDQILGQIAVTDSHFVASSLLNTYVVDLASRNLDWSYPNGGRLAIGESNLVIAGYLGTLTVVAFRNVPEPVSVTPDRIAYFESNPPTVTLTGSDFEDPNNLEVWFGDERADNVVVVDPQTITCTPPERGPGVVDVAVRNSYGGGVLDTGFAYTPCQSISGDFVLGGQVELGLDFEADDGIAVLYDLGDRLSSPIQIPPFIGDFWLQNYAFLFETATWPFDNHLDLSFDIPNEPSLAGETVLIQSAIGVNPRAQMAAFTNLIEFQIQ